MKPFYVYLLQCADGSYYTGQTDNMDARLQQHEAGQVGYTATRKPVALVWQGEFETREGAIAFEQRIKGWSRAKKEALMAGDWTAIQKLAWGTRNPFPTHLTPSIPQDVRGGVSQGVPREASGAPFTVRPEVSKDTPVPSVRPEVSKDTTPSVRPSIPPPVRPEVSKDFSLGARNATPLPLGDPSIPQGERGGVSQGDPSIPQDVRGGVLQGLLLAILHGEAGVQRRGVAKAITLLESTRADHRAQADALLTAMLPHTGKSFRLGISGVPGVGKSTFIEVLGLYLIEQGHRVAVLTIDPSSTVSGGSILGDKTRMERLSVHARAYIRPSPSSGTLGGVAEKTREAMLVCEAAGYDVVIVETVGVGQSETAVANMTDMFVLMQLPNAGDDLQAIKKGVMELADLVVINKADIDALAATRAQAQISASLRLLGLHGNPNDPHSDLFWQPQVIQLSALLGQGVDRFWAAVTHYKTLQTQNGALANRRQQQSLAWMWERIDAGLKQAFRQQAQVQSMLPQLTQDVLAGRVAASTAARALLHAASMNSSAGMEPAQAPANHSTNPWTGTGPQGI